MNKNINILVTLDSNYIPPLKVMLKSLFVNNPKEKFTIYLAHSSINDSEINDLDEYINGHFHKFVAIRINDNLFGKSPAFLYYPKEMYYRLLAHKYLPENMDKILYLDPDILVLNPIRQLYKINLGNKLYGAAHRGYMPVKVFSKVRFLPYKIQDYYNSGVLLMNLRMHRKEIDENKIFDFIEKNRSKLILPDQDLINIMYAKLIKSIDEVKYNYDTRLYSYYRMKSDGKYDMDYVLNNTVVMHFCGPGKPWKKNYRGRFHALYKHYEKIAKSSL